MNLNKSNILLELEMPHWDLCELVWAIEETITEYIVARHKKGYFNLEDYIEGYFKGKKKEYKYNVWRFKEHFKGLNIWRLIELHDKLWVLVDGAGDDDNKSWILFNNIIKECIEPTVEEWEQQSLSKKIEPKRRKR